MTESIRRMKALISETHKKKNRWISVEPGVVSLHVH